MKKKLLENAIMLYVMQFAGYFFSLMVVPYQTRILSQTRYGALSLALGIMMYFTMIIDYGFMVSGVTEIAENRNDLAQLNECLTCVTIIRLVLSLISLALLTLLIFSIKSYTLWAPAFYIYFLSIVLEGQLPSFFLRGMEDMRTVALLTLTSKALATAFIFVLVKSDKEYLLIPGLRAAGAAVSLVIAWFYLTKRYGVRLVKVTFSQVLQRLRESSGYFVSRIASTVYRSGNTAILGIVFPPSMVALYSCPEKLMNVGMTMSSPISDSLLPYITKTHDYKSAWSVIKILLPLITIGGICSFIWAEPIVIFVFGEQYRASAEVLRAMIPIIAVTPINYIVAFPILVPMGFKKQSNEANIIGAAIYIIGMGILWRTEKISIVSVAILLSIAEISVTCWRTLTAINNRDKLKTEK